MTRAFSGKADTDLGFTRDRHSMSPKSAEADLGGFPQKMRPLKESGACLRRCNSLHSGPCVPSILSQAHVVGELLVFADLGGEEVDELARRAAADIVVHGGDLLPQLWIAQRLVHELLPTRHNGIRRS